MRSPLPLVAGTALALAALACSGDVGPGRTAASPAHAKQLIEMGWDEPDPAFMRAHAAEMDTMPFDGTVFHVPYHTADGRRGNFTWETWGPIAYRAADLDSAVLDLQAAHFSHLRSNFLRVNVTPGTVGWFDDPAPVLSNFRLAALVAKAGGAAGLMFDTEPYGRPLFRYSDQPNPLHKSYDEFAAQARLRGGQVMRAIEAGDPGATVFLTLGATMAPIATQWARARLDTTRFGLLAPFVDGMIGAASDSARIVDGLEASFPMRSPRELDKYVELERHTVLPWITNPGHYQKVVSLSFAIWLDHDWQNKGWYPDAVGRNYRSPAQLDSTLTRALELCDDYAWLYSEKPRWWTPAGGRAALPDAYVEAVRRARRAAGLAP